LLRRTVGESVSFHFHGENGLPPVQADPVMLEQVLLNLAVNARDAMPQGGQFLVSTDLTVVDEALAAGNADATPGRYVVITVTDTGTGISPDHLPHIFEPFFTTKEVGKGTGLGLATVYGIIKQHRGWINVRSEPGRGTVFQIYLPSATGRPTASSETSGAPTPPPSGHETVLVVEDEAALRDLVRSILELNGYTVLEAPSGPTALKIWEKHRNQIQLLLTDMVMPDGVNGRELALRLQGEKPGLRVLYTSGYGTEIVGVDFVIEEGVNFLQKPYNPRRLAEAVRACLDTPAPA
jgi:CheY-like chemotaxis protein